MEFLLYLWRILLLRMLDDKNVKKDAAPRRARLWQKGAVRYMIDISGHLRNRRREVGFLQEDQPVVVNCCGYQAFLTRTLSKRRPKGRVDYQMIYMYRGRGEFLVDGIQRSYDAGHLILYRPGEEQDYTYRCEERPEAFWIHFTGSKAGELLEKFSIRTGYVGESSMLKHMFQEIIKELQLKKDGYETMVAGEFCKMLVWISRMQKAGTGEYREGIHLERLILHLNQSYQNAWSVEEMARCCGFSTSYFGHIFKKTMGVSPMQYLTELRMAKAKDLLLEEGMTIAEVADLVGYRDPLYFSRVFKRMVGIPPHEYREDGVYLEIIKNR